jgi:hypothetical protein
VEKPIMTDTYRALLNELAYAIKHDDQDGATKVSVHIASDVLSDLSTIAHSLQTIATAQAELARLAVLGVQAQQDVRPYL